MRAQTEEKILLVDDDPNLLAAIKRQFRRQYEILTAEGGDSGLDILRSNGPFAAVISDMRMPGMSGTDFLKEVRTLTPDTVRVMLTGHADLDAAIEAVNEGNIFRFLTKPCPPHVLEKTFDACLEQHRLVTAERVLLQQTLNGSIKVLTEILSMVNPASFGRAIRIKRYAAALAKEMQLADAWQVELAAMLSQIGCVTIPTSVMSKLDRGWTLTTYEQKMFTKYPEIGHHLLRNIPRLEAVAEIIAYQQKRYDGTGYPENGASGDAIPPGARILKVILDYDELESASLSPKDAIHVLQKREGWYDPTVLQHFASMLGVTYRGDVQTVGLNELRAGMILAEDMRLGDGRLLLARGQEVTDALMRRLKNTLALIGRNPKFCVYNTAQPENL